MLKQDEFNFLYHILANEGAILTQRGIALSLGFSLGKSNYLIKEMKQRGFISGGGSGLKLTDAGMEALSPYKVDNAVIMAAGMSSRFAPLSYETPKGLLKVRGEVLIEREIRQLKEAGINDITIVVGYMKEKFFYLEDKFDVRIVINPDYYRYNNTSSLIRVLDKLSNTYICSSDNYFVDNVFEPYVYRGYYAAVYSEGKTDEYCMVTDQKGRINDVTFGGEDSWYMLGHVYFDREFSERFRMILKREYDNPVTKDQLWENLYIRYIRELDLYIRKYDSEKVWEFDSLDELRSFDPEYINNADSRIMKNICRVLECEMKDIVNIKAIKAGLTNTSFSFTVKDKDYVYRHPGKGTEKYINRRSEAFSMDVASRLGLDDTFIYMDSSEGWKISRFIRDVRELDYHDETQVRQAIKIMHTLHDAKISSEYDFDIWERTKSFISLLEAAGKTDFEGAGELFDLISGLRDNLVSDGYSVKCLCHNDCYSPNFLLDQEGKMYLIDWEYSGNDDPASDMGTFICCSDYTYEEAEKVLNMYLAGADFSKEAEAGIDKGLLRHYLGYVAIASYYWFVWALYQELRGNHVGEWLYLWHKNSRVYALRALELSDDK